MTALVFYVWTSEAFSTHCSDCLCELAGCVICYANGRLSCAFRGQAAHAYVDIWAHVCMSVWRPEVNFEYLPRPLSRLCFEKSVSPLPGTD